MNMSKEQVEREQARGVVRTVRGLVECLRALVNTRCRPLSMRRLPGGRVYVSNRQALLPCRNPRGRQNGSRVTLVSGPDVGWPSGSLAASRYGRRGWRSRDGKAVMQRLGSQSASAAERQRGRRYGDCCTTLGAGTSGNKEEAHLPTHTDTGTGTGTPKQGETLVWSGWRETKTRTAPALCARRRVHRQ